MSHEPECDLANGCQHDYYNELPMQCAICGEHCQCKQLRAAYRRGYNAHAAAAQHWRDTHGAYQQNGAGENP